MVNASVITAVLFVASSLGAVAGHPISLRDAPSETMGPDPPYGPPGLYLSRVRPAIGSTIFEVWRRR